ncbi:adenine-specific methyltransferase EcoRI family protein [Anaerococcus murdochii]|uniref:Adenine-specific methyltransferase EcoRI family protein n=1 Tax=Anaerococcus murdochii TaxID=411577 RepID=A0ABS7T0L7_9FIRM|nr:adenine-specific methyltransferase EcoRI family protein [Anaerococcus murdochii]MBZ2387329.1 adenine-specific methyltransferase EcoRI family protein [Anaerococcus murdochii]
MTESNNSQLANAKKVKNDEFYTRLTDIEQELRYYRKHFKGKTVFCNCDDPFESNFFKYFVLNFNRLGLKKLIATCYATSPIAHQQLSLFDVLGGDESNIGKPYKAVVTKIYDATGDGGIDMLDVAELFKMGENELTELKGDGDFRSDECLQLLEEADIVVTNPPFSLFREYVAILMKYEKQFVIMGNKNAITYKEFFPLLKSNEVWVGATSLNGGRWMIMPGNVEIQSKKTKIDTNGDIILNVAGVCWFTNLDIKKRHEDLILIRKYNPEDYPKYDNYDAINVDKVTEIPYDYEGYMGVPITFMDKYNPDQFDIIGLLQSSTDEQAGIPNLRYYNDFREMRQDMSYTNASGGKANGNPVLKGKSKNGNFLYNEKTKEYVHSVYARILIRNKNPEPRNED